MCVRVCVCVCVSHAWARAHTHIHAHRDTHTQTQISMVPLQSHNRKSVVSAIQCPIVLRKHVNVYTKPDTHSISINMNPAT